MSKKKDNFGQRMKALKVKKKQEAKDKELTDRFPEIIPTNTPMEEVLIIPPDHGAPATNVEPTVIIRQQESPLERAVRRIREQSQGI